MGFLVKAKRINHYVTEHRAMKWLLVCHDISTNISYEMLLSKQFEIWQNLLNGVYATIRFFFRNQWRQKAHRKILKIGIYHDANFVYTDGTGGWHNDTIHDKIWSLTCALRRSIVLQFFWHVDTRPILPFLFFFNSTFHLCIIIVIFYLVYLIH